MPASPVPSRLSGGPSMTMRRLVDRVATGVITVGGWTVVISVLGIFAYLLIEVMLLFAPASWSELTSVRTDAFEQARDAPQHVGVGIDDYREVGYVLRRGDIAFHALPSGDPIRLDAVPDFANEDVTAVSRVQHRAKEAGDAIGAFTIGAGAAVAGDAYLHGLGTANGRVIPVRITYRVTFSDGVRTIVPVVTSAEHIDAVPNAEPIARLAYRETDSGAIVAALTGAGRLWLTKITETEAGLFARERTRETVRTEITGEGVDAVAALLLDGEGDTLVGGTTDGRLLYWDIQDFQRPRLMETRAVGAPVTALAYLIGDRSLVVGTAAGTVAVWMPVTDRDAGGDPHLQKIRDFRSHDGAVTAISPSLRDKGFLTADAAGGVAIHYSTSHQTLVTIPGNGSPVLAATFAPKTDGAIVVHDDGRLIAYDVDNEHPEVTFSSLFLPVFYEGYDEPLPIWQSTGGSDAFESKFGLWPLIFGTLKGTLYAMLLATPIAVLGAIYTAMFMTPAIRAVVKPVVELMAAFPTVILGFLAGLWLAPLLEVFFRPWSSCSSRCRWRLWRHGSSGNCFHQARSDNRGL